MKVRSTVILLALISAVAVAAEKADTDQSSTPNSVPMGPGYGMGPGMMMGPGMGPGMMGRGGPGMMWGAPNEAMQERWAQMQKNLEELQKNTDPEKQQQLMQQMQQMQHMRQMMHGMPGGPGMMHPGMMYPGMMGWQSGPMMGQGGWNWMMAMEQRMRRVEQMLNELLEQKPQPGPGQEKK